MPSPTQRSEWLPFNQFSSRAATSSKPYTSVTWHSTHRGALSRRHVSLPQELLARVNQVEDADGVRMRVRLSGRVQGFGQRPGIGCRQAHTLTQPEGESLMGVTTRIPAEGCLGVRNCTIMLFCGFQWRLTTRLPWTESASMSQEINQIIELGQREGLRGSGFIRV